MKLGLFIEENLTQYWKKLKVEKLQALTKYLLKYGWEENLTTYFFDYVTLSINRTQ